MSRPPDTTYATSGVDRGMLWFGIALVGWIAVLRWQFFLYEPTGYDEGLYLTGAVRMLHGARLYTDVWDNKPVGIYLVYMAIAATLGSSRFAVNLASALAVLASASLVYLIGRDTAGRRAGIIAAFVLPAYSLDIGADGANTETFMMVLQCLSVWLLVRHCRDLQPPGRHLRAAFVFGLLQGALLQMKLVSAFDTAALGLALAGIVWWEHCSIVALMKLFFAFLPAYLACTLAVFAYFAATGGVGDMVFANFISPRLYVQSPFGLADPLHAVEFTVRRASYFFVLILFGLWFIFDWARRGRSGPPVAARPIVLLVAWVIGALLDATSPGYFRYFYFIALTAPLSLFGGLAVDRLLLLRPHWGRPAKAAACAVLALYPLEQHLTKQTQIVMDPESYIAPRVAALVRSLVPAGSTIFIADLNPLIYPLADAVPATKYPQANAHIFDLPERFGVDPEAELVRIFARRPLLVVAGRGRLQAPGNSALLRRFLETDYQPIPVGDAWLNQEIVVYQRQEP
jgi:4-amino-4-deoxy-L-arabinose transferase-like glycosyltransferase